MLKIFYATEKPHVLDILIKSSNIKLVKTIFTLFQFNKQFNICNVNLIINKKIT